MQQNITISLDRHQNCFSIIEKLNSIDKNKSLQITFDFNCGDFINADSYIIITSYINEMIKNGIDVAFTINQKDCDAVNYASRINFFNSLGIEFDERFKRHSTTGNLIPISNIDRGVFDLSEEVLQIFQNDFKLSVDDMFQLPLIMSEMICNSTIHSKGNSGAYLYCQKYKKVDELEFILVDSGIGIHKTLIKNEDFINLDNKEAIQKSLEFGATSGEGRGHGLYFASEFIRRNQGTMTLISGENHVFIGNGEVKVGTNSFWDGVILKFKFKFDAKISLNQLMEEAGYSNVTT